MRDGRPVLVRLPEVDFIDDKEGKPIGIDAHFCLFVHHTERGSTRPRPEAGRQSTPTDAARGAAGAPGPPPAGASRAGAFPAGSARPG